MVQRRIVIVGAGLAGLACALDLVRAGLDVVVLEREPRAGGAVCTLQRDGFTFELGPNTIPSSSAAFVGLVRDLGLEERLLHTGHAGATRWLWFHGRLVPLPGSPIGFFTTPLLSTQAKLRVASEPFRRFVPPEDGHEPSFEEFLTERLGSEATRLLAGSFVRGVYAAEIEELGARSAFPRMWNAAVEKGGLVRGLLFGRSRQRGETSSAAERAARSGLMSFPTGLTELVAALQRELGPRVRLGLGVEGLQRRDDAWIVRTSDGSALPTDRVVLATQAPVAARLLQGVVETTGLRAIRHARVTVVSLGFREPLSLPRGFGYLVPPDESARGSIAPRALGTIFTSNLFPARTPAGGAATASFYRTDDVAGLDDAGTVDQARADLALALRRTDLPRPAVQVVQRWSDVIPRLEPEHDRRMSALHETLRASWPTLHLAGSYVGGVSVDSVIATGRRIAREIRLREALA